MLNIGNEPVRLCEGLTRRSFLTVGTAAAGALTLPTFFRFQQAGAADAKKAKIRNCITIFLVGSPGAARHLGHEAGRARGGARQVQADQDERHRHSDLRALPADGPA